VVKKSDLVERLIKEVKPRHPVPSAPREGVTLLEQGVIVVLMRYMTQNQAEQSLTALKAAYDDWNEARVSQLQELATHLRSGSRKKGVALLTDRKEAALALKEYLQDVFQQTHGLELELLRDDPAVAGKAIATLDVLGMTGGAYLMWVAAGGEVPVHIGLMRMLERLGVISRTTSLQKAREEIAPLVPQNKSLEFTVVMHEVLDRWNDPDEPIYETVAVLRETPYGKKAFTDRQGQLKRQEAQRVKDEARRLAAEKKEAERLHKEEEKAAKRAQAEAKRHARELERRRKADERRHAQAARAKAAEEKKKAAAKLRAAEEKKQKAAAEREKKAAARSKAAAAAKQMAAAKKKAAKKSKKKTAARKSTSKKQGAAKKASARTKPAARKKTATKKAATRKPAARKAAKKSTGAKRPASKKAVAKRKASGKKPRAKTKSAKKISRKR
jgi:histone H1/5